LASHTFYDTRRPESSRRLAASTMAFLLSAAVNAQQCSNVANSLYSGGFNVSEYTRATWYTWKQQVNNYQDEEDLYCVTATYNLEGTSVPGKSGDPSSTVTVYNVASDSSLQVETGAVGEDPFLLCATPDSRDTEADPRLNVKPCFLPPFFGGPYWVVHLEVDSTGRYEVAVVIGGNPTVFVEDDPDYGTLCTTPGEPSECQWWDWQCSLLGNNQGLWILAREPLIDQHTLDRVEAVMKEKGIATAKLIEVPQGDVCNYSERFIKPRDCGTRECDPAA